MRRLSLCLILLTFTASFSPQESHAAQPEIQVNPDTATINSQITVNGENFPSDVKIYIFIGLPDSSYANTPYSAALTDSGGKFTTTFVMPGTWSNGNPIIDHELLIIASAMEQRTTAIALLHYEPAPLETLGWTRYGNSKFGVSLMVPPGWVVQEFDDVVDIQIEDNPQAGSVKLLFTPITFLNGGNIDGKEVRSLPLRDYAAVALQYEIGGAGTFDLQSTSPVTTAGGQHGYTASWEFDFSSLRTVESAGTESANSTALIPELYTVVYFDLNVERSGNFYRAIEISTTAAQMPSPELFKAIIHSIVVSQPMSEADYNALNKAVSAYFQAAQSPVENLYVEVQAVEGDYIRFTTPPIGIVSVDTATGYAKKEGKKWIVFGIGTAFDAAFFEQHSIPLRLQR
jgi:hypothetical protein